MNINIISVNYNTPDLIEKLINSYYTCKYNKYQLIIIDGSDKEEYLNQSRLLKEKYKDIIFDFVGFNIHHGPGLHYGMKKYKADYFLLLDSDSYFKNENMIEYCLDNIQKYAFGMVREYGRNNFNGYDYNNIFISKYLHPNGCFLNYNEYKKHLPLIAHGAPFIETMYEFTKNNIIDDMIIRNKLLSHYIYIGWNGTCSKFGYNLDSKTTYNLNNNKDIY